MQDVSEYPSPSFRLVAVIALFVGVGAGAFAFFSFVLPSISDDGKTVYIQADKSPVKVPPDQPGGMDIPHQDKLVFNAVSGHDANTPERVAPPPEEPVYGSAPAASPAIQSANEGGGEEALMIPASPIAGETDAPPSARVAVAQPEAPAAPPPVALGRAVPGAGAPPAATVEVVKPATISTFNAANANTPAKTAPKPALKAAAKPASPPKVIKVAAPSLRQPTVQAPPVAPVTQQAIGIQAMPLEAPPSAITSEAPSVPTAKVEAQPELQQQASNRVEAAPLMAAEAPPPPTTRAQPVVARVPSASAARFQLASYTDRASAERAIRTFSGKYSGAIGGSVLQVATGTAHGHQVFRIQGSAGSKSEAEGICSRVKSRGGTCVLAR